MTQPIRSDEMALRKAIITRHEAGDRLPSVREIAREKDINLNRAYYLCTKWDSKGWWEWGVNPLSGWLTPAGVEAFQKSIAEEPV